MSGLLWFLSGFGCGVTAVIGYFAAVIYCVRRQVA
jgi:hypothetical protein